MVNATRVAVYFRWQCMACSGDVVVIRIAVAIATRVDQQSQHIDVESGGDGSRALPYVSPTTVRWHGLTGCAKQWSIQPTRTAAQGLTAGWLATPRTNLSHTFYVI